MEIGGLVARRRDHNDERFVVVSVSTKGEELRRHESRIQCDMKDVMGLGEQEFVDLQETLRMLAARVRA